LDNTILNLVKDTLKSEAEAINLLSQVIDESIIEIIKKLHNIDGKIIVTGIGKSAIIAQKIVATFNSTGTKSVFLHAADAIHGDLGIISSEDLVICISKSGETDEIKYLVPIIKNIGVELIAMTSNVQSYLANQSDHHIYLPLSKEADPNNLAPTTSTTLQLAMGDAIAVALLSLKGFTPEKFALLHPGGNLGKMLYTRVVDLCYNNALPKVFENASLDNVIIEISNGRLGATVVLNDLGDISGIITDGDLRRMLLSGNYTKENLAMNIMSKNPKTIRHDALAIEAMELMRKLSITQLIVTNENKYAGIIHIHDLIREGIN
jgi:arabinose-5-phosphate isomerase